MDTMNKRFLVVVHAGAASLHTQWLASPASRNWDLMVCDATGGAHRQAAQHDGVIHVERSGARWETLAQLLADTHAAWACYDHIWLPADDVSATAEDINRLFDIAAGLQLPLAQPALTPDSTAVHPLALHNAAFALRYTSFVDAAAPLFARALLERALPDLAGGDDASRGLRWPRLLAEPARECAVIDRVQVRRSVPAATTAAVTPLRRAGAAEPLRLCFGGFDAAGRLHHLFDAADDGFIARLQSGYADLHGSAAAALPGVLQELAAARAEVVGTPRAAVAPAGGLQLTVGTSIAPKGEAKQRRAIASWRALGFDVVSFNNAEEIRQLQAQYPEVRFVEVHRDGRERTGKPLVRVDDVFAWFRASGLPHGGFINSDIVLQPADAAGFLADLARDIQGALVFSRRVEVDTLERLEGTYYPPGFDVWFWDSCVLKAFDQETDYYVGFPHWDYYAVLMPLLHGFPIRQFAYPVAFHEKHPMYYDVMRDGVPYGLKTFKLVVPMFDRIPRKNDQMTPVLEYFLKHQPGSMKSAEDKHFYFVFLHALDAWFIDVIDGNSEKLQAPALRRALAAAGMERHDLEGRPVGAAVTPVMAHAPAQMTVKAAAPAVAPVATPVPVLSVIIPTFNRAPILRRCLAQLAAQTLPAERFEVIVVDDGSSDDTAQVIAAAGVQHERQANLGPAAARNRGLQRARGQWVLFLNDDALLEPQALQIHLEEHARRGPKAAVLGSFPMHPDFVRLDGPVGHCLNHSDLVFDYWRMGPDKAYDHHHFYTCNLSIAREFVLRHGGFDEGFVRMGAEDIELGLRLQLDGCQIFYRPDCIARHAHTLDAAGLARMYQFRGKGGVHLFVREPRKTPHYAQMPVQRIAEFQALHQRLQPLLAALDSAITRYDGLRFVATGAEGVALDEQSSGIDLRMLWLWPDAEIERLVQTLARNLERHADNAAAGSAPSLEEAAGRLYPALQFVKWYHDTLGMMSSTEIHGYLSARQAAQARLAA